MDKEKISRLQRELKEIQNDDARTQDKLTEATKNLNEVYREE